MDSFEMSLWGPGWASLTAVIVYGFLVIRRALRVNSARNRIEHRILITGSRGKSGTVRLIHAALRGGGIHAYGKITGTTAVELDVHGIEHPTVRVGANGVPEIRDSLVRAADQGATVAVIECMAVTPELITLVSTQLVKPDIVIIPTIRLDHLEEEGHTELQIAMNIIRAVGRPRLIVTAVEQPEIRAAYTEYCAGAGIELDIVTTSSRQFTQPGHHPVNIAVALRVAKIFGVIAANAKAGIRHSSREPEASQFHLWEGDSTHAPFAVVDLGGANDPQSSAEALAASGITAFSSNLIPVIVNRWDRPLRSLSFVSAVTSSNFPVVMSTSTLFTALKSAATKTQHASTLTRSLAGNPHKLSEFLAQHTDSAHGVPTLVLLENVHHPAVDSLRNTLAATGIVRTLTDTPGAHNA